MLARVFFDLFAFRRCIRKGYIQYHFLSVFEPGIPVAELEIIVVYSFFAAGFRAKDSGPFEFIGDGLAESAGIDGGSASDGPGDTAKELKAANFLAAAQERNSVFSAPASTFTRDSVSNLIIREVRLIMTANGEKVSGKTTLLPPPSKTKGYS